MRLSELMEEVKREMGEALDPRDVAASEMDGVMVSARAAYNALRRGSLPTQGSREHNVLWQHLDEAKMALDRAYKALEAAVGKP